MDGSVWVILPTYDEAENLAAVVGGIRAAVPEAHVLVVDDNSRDGTAELADALAAEDPLLTVLHRPGKAGLGRAYTAGFTMALAAGADLVVEMDADLSHDPADLPRLLEAARDADVVLGSRYAPGGGIENWGLERRVLSRAGCVYARRVLGVEVRDLTGGFKCFRATALTAIEYPSAGATGYAFQVELTWRALQLGLDVVEVPIRFRERRLGRSKMSAHIAREAAWRVRGSDSDPGGGGRSCPRRLLPIHWYMKVDELAVVQGWDEARATLRRWNAAPGRIVLGWALGSLAVTALLLAATWCVAWQSLPDPNPHLYPGLTRRATWGDFGFVAYRNSLVLALHALACLAGFIAGTARGRRQEHAARSAIAFVAGATLFSLFTQAFALGQTAADLAAQLGVSPARLLLMLTPHAVPELFALFLPLAAWTLAARRGAWNELLAATIATTAIAVPILLFAASTETWFTPRLLIGLGG